jgi:phenylacetate-coenzyme A ligase PaaK-like adenylate-forming protein
MATNTGLSRSGTPAGAVPDRLTHAVAAPAAAISESVAQAYAGSAHLRARLAAAGITQAEVRAGVELSRLPFTTKADLRDTPVGDYAAVPAREICRVHASSGTTGRRTVVAYTRRDVDDWMEMLVRCYRYAGLGIGDRIQVAVGYGLWTAGIGFQEAAERLGATVIPTGPGNIEIQFDCLPSWWTGASFGRGWPCGRGSSDRSGGARVCAAASSRCWACGRSTSTA